jgi:hypothetical protein
MASRWDNWWELSEAQLLEVETEDDSLVLWHRTPASAAILATGFRDAPQRATTEDGHDAEFGGAYVSNRPLDANEGAKGRDLLRVVLRATEAEIDQYEHKDPEGTYREWCVPADVLNARARVTLWTESEEEERRDG